MLYDIATLKLRLFTAGAAATAVDAWCRAPESRGTLLGCWSSDIGELNELLVLRGYPDLEALMAERQRVLMAADPYGCAAHLVHLQLDSYAPFPGLPDVQPGEAGPVYEIRTYELKTGGLQPTLAAWAAALPERTKVSPCTIALYALDGTPRITHIWPSRTLDERSKARADAVKAGVWPPKGGPDWLMPAMKSGIWLPTAVSPLR